MLDDLVKQMEELKAKMAEAGRKGFNEGVKDHFEKFPNLKSFSWTQYTPYFNDGDACTFGVNSYLTVETEDGNLYEDLSEWELTTDSEYYRDKYTDEEKAMLLPPCQLVTHMPESVMEDLFGDHVQVTVYKDRVEVEDYEHD